MEMNDDLEPNTSAQLFMFQPITPLNLTETSSLFRPITTKGSEPNTQIDFCQTQKDPWIIYDINNE